MRAIVDAGELYRALRDVSKGKARKSIPVLSNALLEVHDGRLTVSCYDLETWTDREVKAIGAQNGATTIPVRLLRDLAYVWRDSGPMLLEVGEHPTMRKPDSVSTAARTYKRTVTPGDPQRCVVVMVTRFNFMARIVATEAEQFPPKPVVLENAA
jgi:DNA polymerase III sliding clamp (beta) subunit (PCNA family)